MSNNTAEYQREWRKRHPEASRLTSRARSRALQRLKDAHPDEYLRYYVTELGKLREAQR